ncbi:MAG: lipoyl synthase [Desulfosarcina sp.]|nr:lipoyl synthase [Desulfosarcina sp.]MBC2745118.1 lipoyl synthase [Desulfosarcina sp.]MBC2768025.1 lipoyl synthase [Desulfosarcina sp.]
MEKRILKEIQIIDWGVLDYGQALVRQQQMVAERIKGHSPDRLVLVEHPPVVTIGRSGSLKDLCIAKEALGQKGVSLHKVDRGGRATFHGPGQLVVYPIVKVSDKDLHAFLKRLLDTVADVLRSYRLVPEFEEGKPGLWVNGAKIASVGLAVRKWVTYHGVALNVCTDPGWFDLIVPCGQPGEKITSMDHEMGALVDISDVKKRFVDRFCSQHHYTACEEVKAKPGRRPQWLVISATDLKAADRMEKRLERLQLATVCKSAHCPNQGECFQQGTATFMILGTRCTRRCRFCAVDKGAPHAPDDGEPKRVAMAVQQLGLTHAVVTSVTRDDLSDGGAGYFAGTIQQIRKQCPGVSVEVLVPDFNGVIPALDTVCEARPDVFNHNIETVPRLYAGIRPVAGYRRSLCVLSYASSRGLLVKSGLMLGLGETENEINKTIMDLKYAGCMLLTLGQYLAPSKDHVPVTRYVPPEEFEMWAETARGMGFTSVASGPLVRSSYRAGQMMDASKTAFDNNQIRKVS